MSDKYEFFYGEEAEQFAFFRIPKAFIKEQRFSGLETEAKLLYGLMLDRMELSRKNGWLDEQQRVYIVYTNDQVREDLNCSAQKAVRFLKQLEEHNLIVRKRRGQGKPSLIYVMNYARSAGEPDDQNKEPIVEETDLSAAPGNESNDCDGNFRDSKMESLRGQETCAPDTQCIETQKQKSRYFQNGTSKNAGMECQRSQNFQSGNFRNSKMESQEVPKRNPNHTNINNTDLRDSIYPSICESLRADGRIDGYVPHPVTEDQIKEQIEYECLKERCPHDKRIDEIVMIITDVLNSSGTFRIKGQSFPADVVHSRFRKLTFSHIEYVLGCMNQVTERIRNIYNYLLTALYSAPATFDSSIAAMVSADQYKALAGA